MRSNHLEATMKTAIFVLCTLLLCAGLSFGQQQINLTAAPANLTLPDGTTVPMWGYSCGNIVSGSTAVCSTLNPNAAGGWSPVVITAVTGSTLQINLTNNLSFTAGTGTNTVPTSLMIVGLVGGGLGDATKRTTIASPDHSTAQSQTWPIVDSTNTGTPPPQGPRVQSFATEVKVGDPAAQLIWSNLKAGTYLIESGTHPSIQGPMGLYGILVVTTAPSGPTAGTAYPATATSLAVSYNAEVPLLFSEIDPVQNNSVNLAVSTAGFSETMVWNGHAGGCGDPTPGNINYGKCYPPAVNYTPLYYMINGVAFNKSSASNSLFSALPTTGTGTVLVRLVNAGLRMHVPSIVGSLTGSTPVVGMSLIAEDANVLPGIPRVQNEVFMAAGKTYDVMINAPATNATALPVFDRELSLSGGKISRDAGMLAYISANGGALPQAAIAAASASALADTYNSVIAGRTVTISDPSKGVLANDLNISNVRAISQPSQGTLTLNADGTFTYVANSSWSGSDSFTYCGNGASSGTACAVVTLNACTGACLEGAGGILMGNATYNSNVATRLSIAPPGILAYDKDGAGYKLSVSSSSVVGSTAGGAVALSACATNVTANCVAVSADGGFNAYVPGAGTYAFAYNAQNSQGTVSASTATVTLVFPAGNNLAFNVLDGADKTTQITDYRWIIEEDRTFYIDPKCRTNPPPAGCPTANSGILPTFGTNFHTSYMPVVATGCTGALSCESGQKLLGQDAVCDVGNGTCRTTGVQEVAVDPSQVHLDPTKRYYISVLPGDAANPFNAGNGSACPAITDPSYDPTQCGHGMGGAPIAYNLNGGNGVNILTQPTPFVPAKLSVFVFEDDFPLNGEQDGGGGIDVLSPNEPGLGGFNITLFDDAGGTGDATGQMTYDMFNMPLANALAGTIDPATGNDACPIDGTAPGNKPKQQLGVDGVASPTGITGTIVTCPKYESDGKTLSPLAGQAVVANMMPGRYGVVATPAADRIARGEEWLQTNTLDGQKAHDSFLRVGEPSFFQEYGPAGYHVSIGFANPAIINARKAGVCNGTDANITGQSCTNTLTGHVSDERMSRTPDERLYGSGSYDSFSFTQCYVSFGDPDGEDFAFTKCDANGNFTLSGLPNGDWRITVFDQWNDMLVDGLSTPVRLAGGTTDIGELAMNQWQANIYTSTFFDANKDGVRDTDASGNPESGLSLVPTNIRFRDGSFSNFNNTDLNGNAGFNEVFPLFSWYVVETDSTRYKNTGTHVVYDAGGPADGTCNNDGTCGSSTIGQNMANTHELVSLPTPLRVPGARYCANADCPAGDTAGGSTGRVDPPWVTTEGWQGFSGQNSFIEFGKTPFATGENGGIAGHVVYASTRPFDDPQLLLQTSWEPLVPNVTINLYQEGTGADGSQTLTLVDVTKTSSFDDWAQGFRSDGIPNMNCPGQSNTDLFFGTLNNQPMWLDTYYNGTNAKSLPNSSQFKCYDGMHNWNQVQPAPYDGRYQFPSIVDRNPQTGAPQGTGTAVSANGGALAGTNCTICVANPTDGTPMLPAGKYVVEVVVPPGYELVKEEDKNILIGDNYIAPVTQQFAGLGNIFILPDQAEIASQYGSGNPYNAQNQTQNLGRDESLPSHEGDTGTVESFWPCVGALRTVPDFISLFPQSMEVSPFAGAQRPLCDRKEVTLEDQSSVLAKFYVFTSTHAAAHFTGVITDDYTSEFDPFSPQFGEKFSPPDLPVSLKDWAGNEISRVYADQWGAYNGLTYSTWEVNPPNPTGYAPNMMVVCMNDPGDAAAPDPLFNPQYSQFCYEIPFMPGQTQYMDTPVVPTSAFAGAGYNNPDCNYPDATPAISEVDGDGVGPWVSAAGHTLTIKALGDQQVYNNGYSGPLTTTAPFNQKTITRHYGFGSQPAGCPSTGACPNVTIGGIPLNDVSWNDGVITGSVPANIPACNIQQQIQYSKLTAAAKALCGQLVITAGNGKQSIDTVTVTVGGKAPTHIGPADSIQTAIDQAAPGDLLMVDPGLHQEMVIMWKPVRLQGVGAVSSVINANTHPAGKIDAWRQRINCLFGLALNGTPISGSNKYDPSGSASCPGTGWNYFTPTANNPQVDRLPLEATVGWDATLNGNLAELLQEPTLMGALEGAGITVLSKGVNFPSNPFAADTFPTGTLLLNGTANSTRGCGANTATAKNPFPSSFWCNPSSIDGLSITDSSQGGGGIFVHAWGHNIQIANNRIHNNAGTLSGGINIGQGEHPGIYVGGTGAANADPGSCQTSNITNLSLPYCFNMHVNVHNNAVTGNSSTGDELFSATPAGAGGVSFCSGSDYYLFNYNWLCGNLSTGDGGGLGHLGFSYNGDIEHNTILFNQSTNPTIPTNGGGIVIMGAPDVDPTCGATTDQDCIPDPSTVSPSDGVGPNLVINANLIMGNGAESGSGGGIQFQNVNGTDVVNFPTAPARWNGVSVTNNIITNNVSGWDGGGVALLDALKLDFINNTVMSNDSTASSGVLFNTLGAPLASTSGPTCTANCGTHSNPQAAGLVAIQNSAILRANMPSNVVCPAGHPNCAVVSYPRLLNDVFWQNRSFQIGVTGQGTGEHNQQNEVALFNADFSGAQGPPAQSQSATGACPSGSSYWDIGVRGDTGPLNHSSTITLAPTYSFLTNITGYSAPAQHNISADPTVVSQYCNGSRVPPENGGMGYQVPPGISDATVPNPVFNLTPAATVDEGNNWINISWGPLSLVHPVSGAVLGNYSQQAGSPVIDYVPASATGNFNAAPTVDFFGNARKTNGFVDVGAVEFQAATNTPSGAVTGGPLDFGNVPVNTTSAPQTLTLHSNGTAALTYLISVPAPFSVTGGTCGASGSLAIGGSCTINVVFAPTTVASASQNLTVTANGVVAGAPVALSGNGVTPVSSALVSPSELDFGNWPMNTYSAPMLLKVTNTGNMPLSGLQLTFAGGSAVFSRISVAPYPVGAPNCAAALAVGASCTIKVRFHPAVTAANTTYTRTLTVSYTGATVTGNPVTLTGTGVSTAATASAVLNPSPITLPTGVNTGTGTVTLTNTSASGGTSMVTTSVATSGGSFLTYFFSVTTDGCTGVALAPGASCTVVVSFNNVGAARGTNQPGTITFTTGSGSTVTGNLSGYATP
jgi:hypothetical protein